MSEEFDALEAAAILEHPLFTGAFDKVREAYIHAIENGDITDDKRRDKLMLGLQNLVAVRGYIEEHIRNAELSAALPEEEYL